MTCDKVIAHTRAKLDCHKRRSPRNEAINYNRHPIGRRCQDNTDQPGNLQTTHLSKYSEWVTRVRSIALDRLLDYMYLVRQLLVVDARPTSGNRCHRRTREHRSNSA